MRRLLALLIAFALCAGAAYAVDSTAQKKNGNKLPPDQVEMPFLMAPVSKNGDLIGFQYISSRMQAASPQAADQVRLKLAFIQDAFVRDVYRSSVGSPNDPAEVDRAALSERLTAIARRIAGNKNVVKIFFVDIKFGPLHPTLNGTTVQPSSGGDKSAAPGQENGQKSGTQGAPAATGGPATSKP
jgi:hypothetical protein